MSSVINVKIHVLGMLKCIKWRMGNNIYPFCLKIQFMNNMVIDTLFLFQCQRISQLDLYIHLHLFLKHSQGDSCRLKIRVMIIEILILICRLLIFIHKIDHQLIYGIFKMLILMTYFCSFSSFISLLIDAQYQMRLCGQDMLSRFVLQC